MIDYVFRVLNLSVLKLITIAIKYWFMTGNHLDYGYLSSACIMPRQQSCRVYCFLSVRLSMEETGLRIITILSFVLQSCTCIARVGERPPLNLGQTSMSNLYFSVYRFRTITSFDSFVFPTCVARYLLRIPLIFESKSQREKGRYLTQSYDKSPHTNRK